MGMSAMRIKNTQRRDRMRLLSALSIGCRSRIGLKSFL